MFGFPFLLFPFHHLSQASLLGIHLLMTLSAMKSQVTDCLLMDQTTQPPAESRATASGR
jgi:hypothetical protein